MKQFPILSEKLYPRDNTPGCTAESKAFNKALASFAEKNTVIVGVSNDSLKKHENFSHKYGFMFPLIADEDKQHKYGFMFPLIADEDKQICELFGVYQLKKFMGKEHMGIVRSTFLINEQGKLIKEWRTIV